MNHSHHPLYITHHTLLMHIHGILTNQKSNLPLLSHPCFCWTSHEWRSSSWRWKTLVRISLFLTYIVKQAYRFYLKLTLVHIFIWHQHRTGRWSWDVPSVSQSQWKKRWSCVTIVSGVTLVLQSPGFWKALHSKEYRWMQLHCRTSTAASLF